MENLLTIQEAATKLNMSVSTLYKWVGERKIPFVKLGRAVRFEKQKIENYINNRSVNAKKIGIV